MKMQSSLAQAQIGKMFRFFAVNYDMKYKV